MCKAVRWVVAWSAGAGAGGARGPGQGQGRPALISVAQLLGNGGLASGLQATITCVTVLLLQAWLCSWACGCCAPPGAARRSCTQVIGASYHCRSMEGEQAGLSAQGHVEREQACLSTLLAAPPGSSDAAPGSSNAAPGSSKAWRAAGGRSCHGSGSVLQPSISGGSSITCEAGHAACVARTVGWLVSGHAQGTR